MKIIACILIAFVCLLCFHTSTFADSVKLPSSLIEIKEEAFYLYTNTIAIPCVLQSPSQSSAAQFQYIAV